MLKEKLKAYKVILASGSPRRQQYFKDLGLDFEIRLKDTQEVYPQHLEAEEITNYLSELKANAFEGAIAKDEIIVTSDTIVWHQNKALGKPKDFEDAMQMLRSLSGCQHEVITSVSFKTKDTLDTIFEKTKVFFNPLEDSEIKYYIENYQPYDKAGGYGIQEWIGFVAIAKIEGSYPNVAGLPVDKVYHFLSNFKSKTP